MVRRGGRDRDGGPEGARPAVGSSAGLRVELRAATTLPEPTGIQDWELCVPGALYKRNDTDHDGVEDYFSAYAHEFRDDRLPSLAVLAYLPARGRYVALTRVTPPAHDARSSPRRCGVAGSCWTPTSDRSASSRPAGRSSCAPGIRSPRHAPSA
jgi:hypothetical protein